MIRLCKICGDFHDLEQPWPDACERHFTKSAAPNVISDTMEPTKHHGTGRMIGSKRAFSAETRRAGMVELGNEAIKPRQPLALDRRARRDAIRQSLYQLHNGQAPRFDA